MPKYSFVAKSQKGESYSGNREARDEHDLAASLRQEGYVLISAETEKEKKAFSFSLPAFLPFLGTVSFKEKMMFARNLRVMVGAGISLPRALNTLSGETKSKVLKKALLEAEEELTQGKSFYEALSHHPNVFSELFRNMVKVGEESGTLEGNIEILARQMEREHELKSKIQSAMVYPAVIILAMMGIGIMMLVMVVPKLAETFEDLQVELPITTKSVIWFSNFLAEKWYILVFILIILFLSVRASFKTETGQRAAGLISLRIPIISSIVKKTNSASTVRNLSALIAAGMPLVRSLEIISHALSNFYYQKAVFGAIEVVKKGGKLSEALKNHRELFSLTVIQMIEVGEETGETTNILGKLGDFFEEEVASATKNLVAVVEPVLMLVVGGVVGFFAISMIQPMYSMLASIK